GVGVHILLITPFPAASKRTRDPSGFLRIKEYFPLKPSSLPPVVSYDENWRTILRSLYSGSSFIEYSLFSSVEMLTCFCCANDGKNKKPEKMKNNNLLIPDNFFDSTY